MSRHSRIPAEPSPGATGKPVRGMAAAFLAFAGGFIIMVIEIVGARLLAGEFGGSFYVWVSQIGVVMVALAAGYYLGGTLADRWGSLRRLAWLLAPAGLLVVAVPAYSPPVFDAIISRHPVESPIPALWRRLDPAFGSAVVFLLPCLVLAMLPPYLIRLSAQGLGGLGRLSGKIIAWSTLGSIAGVFLSGYLLIDWVKLSNIFRLMGALTVLLAGLCWFLDRRRPVGEPP